jgi:hypothetical protein
MEDAFRFLVESKINIAAPYIFCQSSINVEKVGIYLQNVRNPLNANLLIYPKIMELFIFKEI